MEPRAEMATNTHGEKEPSARTGTPWRPLPDSGSGDRCPRRPSHLSILGGGMAGLAAGYYARRHGLPFTVYEGANRVGGNCLTLTHGDFRFDSGAHRFHDKEPAATKEVTNLLGETLEQISVPSWCYSDGQFVEFPLSLRNLRRSLGWHDFARTVAEVLYSRLRRRRPAGDFESFALNTYGRTIAQRFLLNYSEKLWGVPCRRLSPEAATKRLRGLGLRTFLAEAVFGRRAQTAHLDGAFRYPGMGIGTIADRLADVCGHDNIRIESAVTRIFHDHTRIRGVEINGKNKIDVQDVVSTLPLPHFLEMMEPPPPADVLALARGLRFRDVILVALFLERESVTKAATVYFPGPEFPFTRVCEPRNRSVRMSPPGQTSLVAEIPCDEKDVPRGSAGEAELVQIVQAQFIEIGWIRKSEVLDAAVARMKCAYPVRELDTDSRITGINAFLERFANLRISGRNGRFQYLFIHDVIRLGEQVVDELISAPS